MDSSLKEIICESKYQIKQELIASFSDIAYLCSVVWNDSTALDNLLFHQQSKIPDCKMLYVVDKHAIQISSNIFPEKINYHKRGQSLKNRPYMKEINGEYKFQLSSVYISQTDHRPCITAIHQITINDKERLGYLVADFDLSNLSDLPDTKISKKKIPPWRQIKGDPAIRGQLFHQYRATSPMDEHLSQVHNIIANLMCQRGIFHAKLHYSSSRATLWEYDKPHQYNIHVLDEITSPDACLLYKKRHFPKSALVLPNQIPRILERFSMLRNTDETIYLRSASINIINAMVGLTFSCDGSHYMLVDEFLKKPNNFWFG